MPLSDDYDSERVYGDSMEEGASSSDSLEARLSNIRGEVNRNEVIMLPPILIKE